MEKRHAALISIIITLLVLGNFLFFADIFPDREKVIVERVIDGDTIELEDGRKIRLLNINSPEEGEEGFESAKEFLEHLEGKEVELDKEGVERYGRILGRIYYRKDYINLRLVENGLAHKYLVEEEEIKEFKKAEEKAKKDETGIWEKSLQYNCLEAEINKNEEFVVISNNCGNLEGWSIKDESTHSYTFSDISVKSFILYSGSGADTEDEIYWNRGKAWNNDKDSIFVRDKEGKLVYYNSYGY